MWLWHQIGWVAAGRLGDIVVNTVSQDLQRYKNLILHVKSMWWEVDVPYIYFSSNLFFSK